MNNPYQMPIICLMGPTASGKSSLALAICQHFDCEIICVDSAIVYRGMNIGTAKPSVNEQARVPHHLIDLIDPLQAYSAGQFVHDAVRIIDQIIQRGRLPLLVGGTMHYFYRLQQGLADLPQADPVIRADILEQAEQHGWQKLHAKLQSIDASSGAKIHPNDRQRIQRALEIYQLTGKPASQLQQDDLLRCDYQFVNYIIEPSDRAVLHKRIEQRFMAMLDHGLVEEVNALYERGDLHPDLPAIRMVGYRQVWQHLAGQINYDQMVAEAVAATRQFAKRQLTWLRRWAEAVRYDMQEPQLESRFKQSIMQLIKDH